VEEEGTNTRPTKNGRMMSDPSDNYESAAAARQCTYRVF
jgi:hypothetical protein